MRISSTALVGLLLLELFKSNGVRADNVTLYGGPTYSSSTSTGYRDPTLPFLPGNSVANGGTAVGRATKFDAGVDQGLRAVRWDGTASPAVELGNLGFSSQGTTVTGVYGVNSAGTAVGNAAKYDSGIDRGFRAVRWNASGTAATELNSLESTSFGYSFGLAYAVNDANTAVGVSFAFDDNDQQIGSRPIRWDGTGTVATELGNLGLATAGGSFPAGYTTGEAVVVNQAGTAAGHVEKFAGGSSLGNHAVRWDSTGTAATELESLGFSSSGNTEAHVTGINGADTVVGFIRKFEAGSDVGYRAVRWDGGGIAATELGNLGVNPSGPTSTLAYALNNAGTAVGTAEKFEAGLNVGSRAVRWDGLGTAATELGNLGVSLGGFTSSVARAVNEAGAAVGWSQAYDGLGTDLGQRAVYWGLDNVAIDLNTLVDPLSGWSNLTDAFDLSDDGWITGLGTFDPDGAGGDAPYDRMFLLNIQQVPEPSSSLLALCGVVGISHLARRRASC